ncbi:MAG: electron transport complex subunit RsxE [SAR86 cluster bacterium]|uniref:Electron transport complex subunit RsxE n=1 Tax=SAR86 cluster bacterium TaxID=2030880 RepID=A0A2A4XEG1_9GAMM|nr:MAG: electron transport complex subunit RsxE [SAR86 cluster bacterium]
MNDLEIQARTEGMVWENNPVLIQLLGLSPVLAVSSTLAYGIGLGVATFFVCVLSCLTASLLKGTIAHKWRLVWYMLILASYTTIVETISQLYFYPLFLRLGVYLPLICCNVAILIRMETVAAQSSWPKATLDAARTGFGFLIALVVLASCRELLVSGTLFANWQLLLPMSNELSTVVSKLDDTRFFRFANTQAGVLILLGMLVALVNSLSQLTSRTAFDEPEAPVPVKRARVTGRLSRE